MARSRITAGMRDSIVNGLMRHRFNLEELQISEQRKALEKLAERKHQLGYETAYSKAERDRMANLPKGYLPTNSSAKVGVEEGQVFEISFGSSQRVPFEHTWYGGNSVPIVAIIPPDHPYLLVQAEEQAASEEVLRLESALAELKRELHCRAVAVIDSVTTVKRLLEVWPEVHDFLPEENAGPVGNLPAVLVSDLNAALGLTPKEF